MNQSKSYPVDVSSAERNPGYHFRKPSLLEHALTHGSTSNGTISYQRLEFVGDAALYLAMANYLNLSYPDLSVNGMSTLRAANVSNENLARVAVRHNIYPLVRRINCAALDEEVNKFTEAVKQEPEDEIYGGSTPKAPKVLADVVEAIAAAIYQDCNNLDKMWEVVKRFLEPLITPDTFKKNPVTALNHLCQKNRKVLKFDYPRKGKTIICEVFVDNEKVGYGSSEDNDTAKRNAARNALKKLHEEDHEEEEGVWPVMGFPQPALSRGLTTSPQPAPGYNVTVEGRERRERGLPCCGIDIGWLLFILGFFLGGIPWVIGAIICFSRVDYRKKPGYIGCTIAVVLAPIAGCIINCSEKMILEKWDSILEEWDSINTRMGQYP